ncbi:hypothetical protein B0H67DRAFT_486577 [Lasiosphaeris hirsuta]|uniref:Uncharacterized protein n=1 Tax=Lasiosphaeris hirsuta TaxID=260670 RepID=A0AA40AP87_9PEZI|nr:hypothetical protein B0H67DRAFT_486577 [Lasiosphaeris hirsuta]
MNSSQCIEQIILEHLSPLSKEALIKCVEHEGTASNLPGASKVSSWIVRERAGGMSCFADMCLEIALPMPGLSYPGDKLCPCRNVSASVRLEDPT